MPAWAWSIPRAFWGLLSGGVRWVRKWTFKRHALVRQADDILEQDPALLPLAWLKCNDAWYTYIKGLNPANFFGTYDVVRWDTAWLDK